MAYNRTAYRVPYSISSWRPGSHSAFYPLHATRTFASGDRGNGAGIRKNWANCKYPPDLLPAGYASELAKLQDRVPPVSFSSILPELQRELTIPLQEAFSEFDETPLAAASLSQVHTARLKDSTQVVVKIQRPGIEKTVQSDLLVMKDILSFAQCHSRFGREFDLDGWFSEFEYQLHSELDFNREAMNAKIIQTNFRSDTTLHIPSVFPAFSSKRIIVMEKVKGIKISNTRQLLDAGFDLKTLAVRCAHILLRMTLDHGFFHADPHPGNLFVEESGTIGMIDFGMVGRFDEPTKYSLLRVFSAMVTYDPDLLVDEIVLISQTMGYVNRLALKRDLEHILQQLLSSSISGASPTRLFNDFVTVLRKHRIILPSNVVMLFKVIAMTEGTALMLDPQFQITEVMRPYFKRFWLNSLSPRRVQRRMTGLVPEIVETTFYAAAHTRHILTKLENGDLHFKLSVDSLDTYVSAITVVATRIAASILAASIILAASLLMLIYHPQGWQRYGGLVFGLITALAVGALVVLVFQLRASSVWQASQKRAKDIINKM